MSDFGDALRKGLDSHRRAVEARTEMDAILADASKEVQSVTGSAITLKFGTDYVSTREPSAIEVASLIPAPTRKIDVLEAMLPSGMSRTLAEVEFSEIGYPVRLQWANNAEFAGDKDGLKSALIALLGHPDTGAKIAGLTGKP